MLCVRVHAVYMCMGGWVGVGVCAWAWVGVGGCGSAALCRVLQEGSPLLCHSL